MTNKRITDPMDPHDYISGIEDRWLPNIGKGFDNFSRRGHSITNGLEWDAVRRLRLSHPHLPAQPAKYEEADLAAWRALWVEEAGYMQRFMHPGSSDYAAAEILLLSSRLRTAIAEGEAEKAAALGALVICYAIAEGYAPKMEAVAATNAVLRKAKSLAYDTGAGKAAKDFEASKDFVIRHAAQLWKLQPELRIGEVADECCEHLSKNLHRLKNLEAEPRPSTVKGWLREAAAAGKLVIPEPAQRRGRPPKNDN
jgi:hypothetical protein